MTVVSFVQALINFAVVLYVILQEIDNGQEESVVAPHLDAPVSKLNFVERVAWEARLPSKPPKKMKLPVSHVIISETGTPPCSTQSECVYRVRLTQSFDIESLQWDDIGCNFMIGGDGYAYVGRGWEGVAEGLHGYDPLSVGITFIGTFKNAEPPSIQLKAAQQLIKSGVDEGIIAPDYKLLTLRQIAHNANPGDALYSIVRKWPHWIDSSEETESETTLGELGNPRFVEREAWGAEASTGVVDNLTLPVPYVMISHTATDFCQTQSECSFIVRWVQAFHAESQHWSDIGYNFLVGGDGSVYVGRGWNGVGAHSYGYNNRSIGISFVGTFNDVPPPKRQLQAAKQLIDLGVEEGKVRSDYTLLGHRQVSRTLSPGDALYNIIKKWSHWAPIP